MLINSYSYHLSSNPKFFCVSSAIDFQSSSGVRAAQGTVDAKKSTQSLHISQNLLTLLLTVLLIDDRLLKLD